LEEVGEAFRSEVAQHGYVMSACRGFEPTSSGTKTHNLFRNWTNSWAKLSDQKDFATKSPVVAAARGRMMPFTWLDIQREKKATRSEQEVWDNARAFGWRNGFVLPVHGPRGYYATVSMASTEQDLDLGAEQRLRLRIVAMLAHERCRALTEIVSAAGPRELMSARELECLRWVAAGKTDWEIGMILSISAATVKFHVDRARIKLGARTRAQAVARLILGGLY
jgi:DNA-binding CsgD family transcriptional regulator